MTDIVLVFVNLLLGTTPAELHPALYGAIKLLDIFSFTSVPTVTVLAGNKILFTLSNKDRICILNKNQIAYRIGDKEGITEISNVLDLI